MPLESSVCPRSGRSGRGNECSAAPQGLRIGQSALDIQKSSGCAHEHFRTLANYAKLQKVATHAVSDRVEAAYRRGDLFEKRRKLMEAWGAYCATPTMERGAVCWLCGARRRDSVIYVRGGQLRTHPIQSAAWS